MACLIMAQGEGLIPTACHNLIDALAEKLRGLHGDDVGRACVCLERIVGGNSAEETEAAATGAGSATIDGALSPREARMSSCRDDLSDDSRSS